MTETSQNQHRIVSGRLLLGLLLLVVVVIAIVTWQTTRQPAPAASPLPPSVAPPVPALAPDSRVVALPEPPSAAEPADPAETAAAGVNAADLYRRAFDLLEQLTPEEKELLRHWRTNAVPPELCAKLEPVATLATEARAATHTDWGVEWVGFQTVLKHLGPARNLAGALVRHAAWCRGADTAGAGADILATLRLGQAVADPGPVISHLVDSAIQTQSLDYLAEHLHTLPAETMAQLVAALSDQAYEESMFQALEMEAAGIDFEADRLAAGTGPFSETERALLSEIDPGGLMTRDQLVAEIRMVAAWEREWVTALEWTDTAYAAWRARLDVELQTNPVARVLMPALDGSIERTRATVVRRALVLAAARVYQEGPAALTQVLDPASGQPFVYRYTAGGFELESSYRYKDETIRYTFPNH